MGDVSPLDSARRGKTKPQQHAGATSEVSKDDLLSGDEVKELTALKTKLAEALARPDIHERDLKAVSVEYRAVRLDLKEAIARANAKKLGQRDGSSTAERGMDDDI